METKNDVQENVQDTNDKISKEFDKNFKKLVALIGGEKNLKKPIVPNDEVGAIVIELLKERREDIIKDFKESAKKLLNKKIEFDKETKKAEEDLKKIVLQKKKEFSDEMKKVFSSIENIGEIEKSYYNSMKEINN